MRKNDAVKREEHELLRNKAAMYDFTHGRIEITGPDARSFLDELCTNYISKVKPGKATYTAMVDEAGTYVDDVIIFCHNDEKFQLVTARADATTEWMKGHINKKNVKCENISAGYAMWSIQGPDSRRMLLSFLEKDISAIPYFGFMENNMGNMPLLVSRTGFTGELGFEIFVKEADVPKFLEALVKAGEPFGARIIPKDVCIESIPMEKGLLRYRDFVGVNPLEVDMDWMLRWDKAFFVGQEALKKIKEDGAAYKLKGFICENDEIDIVNDSPVKCNGAVVGKVTCANYGFTVEKSIGFCRIETKHAKEGTSITIVTDGKEVKATVVERMFYDKERKKVLA